MNVTSETQTLTSLAMLKVDLDQQHRSYVDYVSPFVIEVLQTHRSDVISEIRVADGLLASFGLRVPSKVVQHVLRRLQRKGYLRYQDGIFTVNSTLPTSDLSRTRCTARNHIERVIASIIAEAEKSGLKWGEEEATRAVTSFLGKFTVDCLRTYVFNSALPKIPESKSSEQYIVGRFIRHAREHDNEAFESFIVLVKGLMYSNALLCPDLESLEKKFQNVTFYFDTPLLLNLIGLQGEDAKRNADELVQLLIRLRASLAAFSHTIAETQSVISAAAANLNNPKASGRVTEEARRSGIQLSDLIIARDSIDEKLRRMGVSVHRTPEYTEAFQIDVTAFESALAEEIYYKGENALINDVNSVRSIYALRKGKQPVRLEDCGAVFVTTNSAFARTAFNMGREHNSSREVSAVITAYSLANIAWLKSPVEAPQLPIRETMALCFAALEPSPELFNKYVQEMDRLLNQGQITSRDHEILRLSPSAREELMELTLGDEHALTVSSISNILANVKETIVAEQTSAHNEHVSELTRKHLERERELESRAKQAESAASAATAAVRRFELREQRKQEKRVKTLRWIAHAITLFGMVIASGTLFVGALAGTGFIAAGSEAATPVKYGIPAAIVLAVVWGYYSWHTGATVRSIADKVEDKIFRSFLRRFSVNADWESNATDEQQS